MRRKAQTATEYMLILAIVIIIALIVAGILGQFPVMGGSARNRGSSAYWKSAEIGIVSHSISTSNTTEGVYLEIQNNQPNNIRVTNVTIGNEPVVNRTEFVVLNSGESRAVTGGNGSVICAESGDSYVADVYIEYKDLNSGNTYSFDGKGNRLEGTCAQ